MSKESEKQQQQLELLISAAKESKSRTPEELLDYVISLYGEQFIKANDEIARLKSANDELFKIKQRVVIVNRELLNKNTELIDRVIVVVKTTLDDCTHPDCIVDRKEKGFSNCAGGHLARKVVTNVKKL
jgi:hypothetical protein